MRKSWLRLILVVSLFTGCGKPQPTYMPRAEATGLHPTVKWVLACRNGQGGFGSFPGDSAFTSCTGMALEVLAELGALDSLSGKDSLIIWIKSRQNTDGGFFEAACYYGKGAVLSWGTNSALEPTWWAVHSLKLLGAEIPRSGDIARFITAHQLADGAFDAFEYAGGAVPEALYTTFWAVAALKELGLQVPDSIRVTNWVKKQQETVDRKGGFALSPDNFYFSSVAGTYYAVHTLALLGAGPVQPQAVKKFLLSSYGQEADGGFEVGHGDNWNNYDHYSRMQDTYAGVSALALLGMPLTDQDTSQAARPASDCAFWIGSVQNPDGGFGRLGVTEQTPLKSPSEMPATWQAVHSLSLLGKLVPRPARPRPPEEKMDLQPLAHRNLCLNHDDPVEIWAYRRIAAPIYSHYLQETGSRIYAVGMLSRWVRAAVGPENQTRDRQVRGRRHLMHGWGQCGTMSRLLQALAASVGHASRGAYVYGDANAEVLIQEKGWDKPHWVCYIPFTNEYIDPGLVTPEETRNGWSALDLVIDYAQRSRSLNYISKTKLGDHRYWRVWIPNIDDSTGVEKEDLKIDTTMTYNGEPVRTLYPGGSW